MKQLTNWFLFPQCALGCFAVALHMKERVLVGGIIDPCILLGLTLLNSVVLIRFQKNKLVCCHLRCVSWILPMIRTSVVTKPKVRVEPSGFLYFFFSSFT